MVNEDSSTNVYAWVSCLVFSFKLFFRIHEFHLSITISAFHAFRVFFSFLPLHVERYSSEKLWIIFPFSLSHIVVFGLYRLFTLGFFFLSMSDCSKRLTKCWFPSLKDSFFFFNTDNCLALRMMIGMQDAEIRLWQYELHHRAGENVRKYNGADIFLSYGALVIETLHWELVISTCVLRWSSGHWENSFGWVKKLDA